MSGFNFKKTQLKGGHSVLRLKRDRVHPYSVGSCEVFVDEMIQCLGFAGTVIHKGKLNTPMRD